MRADPAPLRGVADGSIFRLPSGDGADIIARGHRTCRDRDAQEGSGGLSCHSPKRGNELSRDLKNYGLAASPSNAAWNHAVAAAPETSLATRQAAYPRRSWPLFRGKGISRNIRSESDGSGPIGVVK